MTGVFGNNFGTNWSYGFITGVVDTEGISKILKHTDQSLTRDTTDAKTESQATDDLYSNSARDATSSTKGRDSKLSKGATGVG